MENNGHYVQRLRQRTMIVRDFLLTIGLSRMALCLLELSFHLRGALMQQIFLTL
jgi:hypothetical protein